MSFFSNISERVSSLLRSVERDRNALQMVLNQQNVDNSQAQPNQEILRYIATIETERSAAMSRLTDRVVQAEKAASSYANIALAAIAISTLSLISTATMAYKY